MPRTRWTLATLQLACDWFRDLTLPGIQQLLDRLGIVWKRARAAVRSPDLHYAAKRAYLAELQADATAHPDRHILLYLDEVTIARQPTVTAAWTPRGRTQARAFRSHAADTLTRVVATLQHGSGQVVFRRASKIRIETLVAFYQDLRHAYPRAERISVVQDNWPVHTHPDLLVALAPQTSPFAFHRPGNWPTTPSPAAVRRWSGLQLPIQIVPLPTYASWCNPIEKLWRKLRQDVTHLHRSADDLPALRHAIDEFLTLFDAGSATLLRYVGLGHAVWPGVPD
jgi:transposase